MRRAFTLQMHPQPDHDCYERGKRMECRLDCVIEWVPTDREVHPLDLGEDTLCSDCIDDAAGAPTQGRSKLART